MYLPSDAIIAVSKLTDYLLVHKNRNDKSAWLSQAGYTLTNWKDLENDLRAQVLVLDAVLSENTTYGQTYEIRAEMIGPNGRSLRVRTVWMQEHETGTTKFITMFPDKL